MPLHPPTRLLLAAALALPAAPALADTPPADVDILGIPVLDGSHVKFNFDPAYIFDDEGNQRYQGHRFIDFRPSVSIDAGFINLPPIPVGIHPFSRNGQPSLWSNGATWNNPLVWIGNGAELGLNAGADLAKGGVSGSAVIETVDTFINNGPTEQTLNVVPVAFDFAKANILNKGGLPDDVVKISIGGGLKLRYDVSIDSGAHVVRNQNAIVEDFTVQSGALMSRSGTFFDPNDIFSAPTEVVGGTPTFRVNGDFTNAGTIIDLNGQVGGVFNNTGTIFIDNGFSAVGSTGSVENGNFEQKFFNTGEIRVNSGSLTISGDATNLGTIAIDGGTLRHDRFENRGVIAVKASNFGGGDHDLHNSGVLRWEGGTFAGSIPSDEGRVFNNSLGLFVIEGSSTKSMTSEADLYNSGKVVQEDGVIVEMAGYSFWNGIREVDIF